MALFAAYEPAARGVRSTALRVRAALPCDIPAVARLMAEREEQPLAAFGFEELTRDFAFPGVDFAGGMGILFGCMLNRPRLVA